MARRGPLPAEDTGEWEYVLDVPNRKKAPVDLPDVRGASDKGDSVPWHPQTLKWWNTMRALPHTVEWRLEDWHALADLR